MRRSRDRSAIWFGLLTAVAMSWFLILALLGRLSPASPWLDLGREDALVEYLGAFAWAAASIFCLARLLRGRQPRLLLALWAMLSLLFFGEEVSWFQRILGFETPAAFEDANIQGEFNLHNLSIEIVLVDSQWLFRAGFAAYFLVLPLLMASSRIASWVGRAGYRSPDAWFLVMVWSVVAWAFAMQLVGGEAARRVISESRETFYALTVLAYVYLYLGRQPAREERLSRQVPLP